MEGCGMRGVSRGVESEMREVGGGGYGGDTVTGVGKYEEETKGVTCEYMVGGVAVLAVPDGGGGRS